MRKIVNLRYAWLRKKRNLRWALHIIPDEGYTLSPFVKMERYTCDTRDACYDLNHALQPRAGVTHEGLWARDPKIRGRHYKHYVVPRGKVQRAKIPST